MSRAAQPFARHLSILLASTAMIVGYSQMTAIAAEPNANVRPRRIGAKEKENE